MTRDDQANAAYGWWKSLGPSKDEQGRTLPGNRAALARLRRCSTVLDVIAEPATGKLVRALGINWRSEDGPPGELERAAALAGVLAHVRESDRRKIATAIGAPPGGDAKEALLKPTRFRTLMAARTGDELLIGFRRAVAILDRKANIRDLSKVIFGWSDDEAGDRVRTRFAFDFYGASDYAPQTSTDTIATPSEKV